MWTRLTLGLAALGLACGPPADELRDSPPSPQHEARMLAYPGGETEVLQWGAGDRVVVLLHGFNMSPHMWDGLGSRLGQTYRVLAYAQRGHGKATPPSEPFTLDDLVGDLAAVMDSLKVDSAFLVAHSFGGLEITRFAETHPERVRGLIYVDAHLENPGNPFPYPEVVADQPFPPCFAAARSIGPFRECVADYLLAPMQEPAFYEELLQDMVTDTVGSPPPYKSAAEHMASSAERIVASYSRDYARLQMPTLFFFADGYLTRGTEDSAWNAQYESWLAQSDYSASLDWYRDRILRDLPDARLVTVVGAAHDNIYLYPEVADEIERFLDRAAEDQSR